MKPEDMTYYAGFVDGYESALSYLRTLRSAELHPDERANNDIVPYRITDAIKGLNKNWLSVEGYPINALRKAVRELRENPRP